MQYNASDASQVPFLFTTAFFVRPASFRDKYDTAMSMTPYFNLEILLAP
jgi:hypothetical protein